MIPPRFANCRITQQWLLDCWHIGFADGNALTEKLSCAEFPVEPGDVDQLLRRLRDAGWLNQGKWCCHLSVFGRSRAAFVGLQGNVRTATGDSASFHASCFGFEPNRANADFAVWAKAQTADELRGIAAQLRLYAIENERYAMVDLNRYLDGTPGGELLKLKRQCSDCRACPHGSTRSQVAFARGDERSTIAFVGEAPDERDESQGHPFASGFADGSALLLDRMIGKMREHATAIGVTFPEQPYICNVLKCRPSPKLLVDGSDVAACSQWLWQQLRLLPNLRVVVALGRVAAQTLLQVEEPIGQLRAEDKAYHTWDRNQEMSSVNQGRVKLIVTWHPLYLLRQPNNKQPRQESWSDLQRAVEVLR